MEENVTEGTADVHMTPIPPGYLPDQSVKVKPLRLKELENITRSVIASYCTLSTEEQFEISRLTVELQELVLFDHPRSKVSHTKTGMAVTVPQSTSLRCQPKNQLLPIHEVKAVKSLKKGKTSKTWVLSK